MKGFILLVSLLWLGTAQSIVAKTYDINNYGAEADGKTLNTIAIQKAVDACTPGDTVLIPAGRYLTGTIHLKSNITLYLEQESVLIGSTRLTDYESNSSTSFQGILYTTGAQRVSIAGRGVIQGNSQAFSDLGKTLQYLDTALFKHTRQQGNYRNGLNHTIALSANHPQSMISFSNCKSVTVSNINLLNAAGTALNFEGCEGVAVKDVTIQNPLQIFEALGVAIAGCKQVSFKGCDIRSGGDAISISGLKGGPNQPLTQSQNISIASCALQSSSTAINISALNQASVSGVQVSHVNIMPSGRGIGLLLRSAGSLENMTFNDMYIETKLGQGNWEVNGEPIHLSAVAGADSVKLGTISNIAFNNVFCIGENQILLYGSAQSMLRNVQFNDVVFQVKNSAYNPVMGGNIVLWGNADGKARLFASNIPAIMANCITGLSLNNVKVSWMDDAMPSYFTSAIRVSTFKDFKLNRYSVKAAPLSRNIHAVELIDGRLATVDAGDVSRVSVQDNKPVKSALKPANQKSRHK